MLDMGFVEKILILFGVLSILEIVVRVYLMKTGHSSGDKKKCENSAQQLPNDWVIPLNFYVQDGIWYAWDLDGNFITQATTKELLLLEIMNKLEVPPKRLVVNNDTPTTT
jgi:hypothetical protein